MKSYIKKVFIVDREFMSDLKERSRKEYELFTEPELDTKIICLPLSEQEAESLTQVIDSSAICAGSILIKPNYSQDFVPVDHFSEEVVIRKYGLFVQFCVVLGAKKVSILNEEGMKLESGDSSALDFTAAGGGFGTSVNASAGMNRSNLNHHIKESAMSLNTVAEGGEPDIDTAKGLMDQYGLHKDPLFSGLLIMRQSKSNKLQRHELTLDSSKDVSRIFDSSMNAKLDVLIEMYKGKAGFEQSRKVIEKNKVATKLSVVVEF